MTEPIQPFAKGQGRLPGIEALRFFAALCILLLHTRAVFGGQRVFGKGYLAVEFFLMLSGFLMAYAQEARIKEALPFMVKRYRRLWPTMTLGGVIGLPRLFIQSKSLVDFATTAVAKILPCSRSGGASSPSSSTSPPGRSSTSWWPTRCTPSFFAT